MFFVWKVISICQLHETEQFEVCFKDALAAEWFEEWAAWHREARHNFSPSADRIIQVTEGCANRNDFLIRTVGILWNIMEHYIMNCAECMDYLGNVGIDIPVPWSVWVIILKQEMKKIGTFAWWNKLFRCFAQQL